MPLRHVDRLKARKSLTRTITMGVQALVRVDRCGPTLTILNTMINQPALSRRPSPSITSDWGFANAAGLWLGENGAVVTFCSDRKRPQEGWVEVTGHMRIVTVHALTAGRDFFKDALCFFKSGLQSVNSFGSLASDIHRPSIRIRPQSANRVSLSCTADVVSKLMILSGMIAWVTGLNLLVLIILLVLLPSSVGG